MRELNDTEPVPAGAVRPDSPRFSSILPGRRAFPFRLALGILLTAIVAFLVSRPADWSQLVEALRVLGQRPALLAALFVSYTGVFALRAFAWRQLITAGGNVFALFTYLQAALLANHLLPFKLGEAARPLLAARNGVPLAQAAASTGVARLLDFVSLVLIAAVFGLLLSLPGGRIMWLQSLAFPAALVCAAAAGLMLIRVRAFDGILPAPLRAPLNTMRDQLAQLSRARVARAVLLTIPSWILEAGVLLVAAQALGVEISVSAAIAVTAFTILFQVFHVTPGGIGVYEASMTGALYALGIPGSRAWPWWC